MKVQTKVLAEEKKIYIFFTSTDFNKIQYVWELMQTFIKVSQYMGYKDSFLTCDFRQIYCNPTLISLKLYLMDISCGE